VFKRQLDTPSISMQNTEENKPVCKVAFYMDHEGNIEIDLDWPPEMDDVKLWASNYSALISVINYGGFKGDIVKLLLQVKEDKEEENTLSRKFISYTLNRLSEAEKITALNSDKPVISPRKAFIYQNKA